MPENVPTKAFAVIVPVEVIFPDTKALVLFNAFKFAVPVTSKSPPTEAAPVIVALAKVVAPADKVVKVDVPDAVKVFNEVAPVTLNVPPNEVVPATVKLFKSPTLVKLELTTLLANVVPVNVPAAAATVISELPLNATPLIFLEVARVVAVLALPVNGPTKVFAVIVPVEVMFPDTNALVLFNVFKFVVPVTSKSPPIEVAPVIFALAKVVAPVTLNVPPNEVVPATVKLFKLPTLVKLELTTLLAKVVPDKVPDSAAIVMF